MVFISGWSLSGLYCVMLIIYLIVRKIQVTSGNQVILLKLTDLTAVCVDTELITETKKKH